MLGIGKAEGDDDVFTFLLLDGSMTSYRAKGTYPSCIRVMLHYQVLAFVDNIIKNYFVDIVLMHTSHDFISTIRNKSETANYII